MKNTLASAKINLLLTLLVCTAGVVSVEKALAQNKEVQQLIQDLNHDDDRIRRDAAMHLSDLAANTTEVVEAVPALIKALGDSQQQVWFHSITALSRLGPDAALAIPELIEGLREMRRGSVNAKWYRSAHALGQMGEAAVEPLLEACKNSRSSVRAGAAKALEWIPEASPKTAPVLIQLLEDDDDDVREIAAESLSLLPEPALQLLEKNIHHQSDRTRKATYLSLGKMGTYAQKVSTTLLDRVRSEQEPDLISVAVDALANMGADQGAFLSFLEDSFSQEDDSIQQAIANAILSLPPERTVPTLIRFLESDVESVKSRAADLLGHMGPPAAPALGPLLAIIEQGKGSFHQIKPYQEAYVAIGLKGIPVLLKHISTIESFTTSHWSIQLFADYGMIGVSSLEKPLNADRLNQILAALGAFARMGTNAANAEKSIVTMTHHESDAVRSAAVQALASIGIKPTKLSPLIEPLLDDKSLEVRQSAVSSLRKSPDAAASQLDKLSQLLNDPAPGMRENALLAIASTGKQATDLAEGVAMLLADSTPAVRISAISTLGAIGAAPDLALRQMDWLARNGDDTVLLNVLKAMGNMADRAKEYLPLFEAALSHSKDDIREAAFGGYITIEKERDRLLPVMIKALDDKRSAIRHESMKAMSSMREDAAAAIPNLIARLDHDEDQDLALGALRFLPSKIEFIENYQASLDHNDPGVRQFGCQALGKLGKDAQSALPKLRETRRDRYRFVREEANKAIERIED